ncbi:MAG: tryptophan--tRNA ligase [Actinomycetaceae bacterium]|nr:tryptophan--tRNA ligase [Actinomycetaceae bacterium]MDY6083409.1 tryptophan--tRNA ligase [Actinomycetaceae bacterium]
MSTHAEEALASATSDASLVHAQKVSAALEAKIAEDPSRFRVLTGDRPTGNLHIGHYFGSLLNRVKLQQQGVETWLVIADFQVITDRDGVGPIKERVYSLATDYLAAGMDPEKTVIFPHSALPELNELMLPFLSLVTEAELHRNPTVKTELDAAGRQMSGLMLTYPVHQAADILFCKANVVPVGKDQLPHLEQARLIADRFEKHYGHPAGTDQQVFPRPQALLSESGTILGLDGTKMSKSKGNTIELRMSEDETAKRIKKAVTDSERHITFDPENRPEVSNLLTIAALSQNRDPRSIAEEIGDGGAGTLKKVVTESLNETLRPLRSARAEIEKDPAQIHSILQRGIETARAQAQETLSQVREAMNLVY